MIEKIRKYIKKTKNFLQEVWIEVNPRVGKVSWPAKKIILGSTIVVLITVSIIALYIFIVDMISAGIMGIIIGR
jgi:preprotein translocase SecE subunit